MADFKDLFSEQASEYARYRPDYPPELFRKLAALSSARTLAWDCGTGSGQAAVGLAEVFQKVIATDASDRQLYSATPHPKVEYRSAPAERSGLQSGSVNLITAAQSFHWFRQSDFFAEVRRVAHPGAILAVWCYELCLIEPKIDALVKGFYTDTLGKYWDPGRKLVEQGYAKEKFPFKSVPSPKMAMVHQWNLAEFYGYLGTWSALQKYIKEKNEDPRMNLITALQKVWGDPNDKKTLTWPLSIRIFRVE
ncbi:MAG TPA: class I SAM-dependent methyltransferase [Bdellovibrionota bacterium]|jgi:hypothetical protein